MSLAGDWLTAHKVAHHAQPSTARGKKNVWDQRETKSDSTGAGGSAPEHLKEGQAECGCLARVASLAPCRRVAVGFSVSVFRAEQRPPRG